MIRLIFSILAMLTVNICNAELIISPPTDYGTFTVSSQIDFGMVALGSDLQPEITILNTGVSALQLGDIASTMTVVAPFRVVDVGCANSFIQPGDQCSVIVLFEPTAAGSYADNFNIEIVSEGISHEVMLSGDGAALADEPDIQISFSSINFGTLDVLESTDAPYLFPPAGSLFSVILVENNGDSDLVISSVNLTGQDSDEVNVLENCVTTIVPGDRCGFSIEFKPLSPGVKNAAISFVSNDPDEAVFDFFIRGIAVAEDDGVPPEVEDAGPNNGDGNNDDILDSKQSHVATLIDYFGNYVTYLMDDSYRFKNMSALNPNVIGNFPADLVVGSGIFDFSIENIGVGQSLEVGIILPAGVIPKAYYMYGPTADNPDKHWFDFSYDGETGAIIIGDVTFTTSSGAKFTRSVLKVIFKDGGRGDTDLTVNGTIAATSAMPISQDSGGSGSVSLLQLLCLSFMLILARNAAPVRSFFGSYIKH